MMDEPEACDGSFDTSPIIEKPSATVEVPPDGDTAVSVRVVEALAEIKGISPVELETPLYESIDPETLDALVESGSARSSVRVEFTIDGYRVTVTAEGTVFVGDTEIH